MNPGDRTVAINLATRPVRNMRLFRLVRTSLVLVMALSVLALVFAAVRYAVPSFGLRSSLSRERAVLAGLEAELRKNEAGIRREETALGQTVREINEVIYMKSFSWTGLLTEVEKALPVSCRLAGFSPGAGDGRSVPVRLSVVSAGLPDLMRFVEGLNAGGFRDIRTTGEEKGEGGGIITSMSLTYERHE